MNDCGIISCLRNYIGHCRQLLNEAVEKEKDDQSVI